MKQNQHIQRHSETPQIPDHPFSVGSLEDLQESIVVVNDDQSPAEMPRDLLYSNLKVESVDEDSSSSGNYGGRKQATQAFT